MSNLLSLCLLGVLAAPAAFLFGSPASLTQAPQSPSSCVAEPKITTCLWFHDQAEAALRLYCAVFPNTKALDAMRWGEGGPVPKGTLLSARVQVEGQTLQLLNGNTARSFTEACSLVVACDPAGASGASVGARARRG